MDTIIEKKNNRTNMRIIKERKGVDTYDVWNRLDTTRVFCNCNSSSPFSRRIHLVENERLESRKNMLTFEQKLAIIEQQFPELERADVAMGRVNFHCPESLYDKTIVVQHLHPKNGNAFVYVEGLPQYEADKRGLVNVKDVSEEAFVQAIRDSIELLTVPPVQVKEQWTNERGETMILAEENEFWALYYGDHMEDNFGDYTEAADYLLEEGFEFSHVLEEDE